MLLDELAAEWKEVSSGLPRGSILSREAGRLMSFADDTRLGGAGGVLNDRARLQMLERVMG